MLVRMTFPKGNMLIVSGHWTRFVVQIDERRTAHGKKRYNAKKRMNTSTLERGKP